MNEIIGGMVKPYARSLPTRPHPRCLLLRRYRGTSGHQPR